jgi:hypothetical protein
MKLRRWFIISLALAAVALYLQLWGMSYASHGSRLIARATQMVAERGTSLTEDERAEIRSETAKAHRAGVIAQSSGAAFAMTSVGFMIASARKREPAWRSLMFAVLFCYAMSFFILV